MQATKIEMIIKVEVLSVDSIPALLDKVQKQLITEFMGGQLTADDGDHIEWLTTKNSVFF